MYQYNKYLVFGYHFEWNFTADNTNQGNYSHKILNTCLKHA